MSTPISSIHDDDTEATDTSVTDEPMLEVDDEASPTLEVDNGDDAKPLEAVEAVEAGHDATQASETEATTDREDSKSGRSMLALVLGGLLLVSIAINLQQSRSTAALEARQSEYEQALAAAVERIDAEAARAEGAEAALDRVDSAVDVVNERVAGLQDALDELRAATVR